MKRRIHRAACAVLALLALSLTGAATSCSWKPLIVEIPGEPDLSGEAVLL